MKRKLDLAALVLEISKHRPLTHDESEYLARTSYRRELPQKAA